MQSTHFSKNFSLIYIAGACACLHFDWNVVVAQIVGAFQALQTDLEGHQRKDKRITMAQ